jgi:hypothetical protein
VAIVQDRFTDEDNGPFCTLPGAFHYAVSGGGMITAWSGLLSYTLLVLWSSYDV